MNIARLCLFWLMWYLVFGSRIIVSPVLPLVEETFAINHAAAGGLYVFFAVGATIGLLLAGPLSLRIGFKKVITIGLVTLFVSSMALYFAATYGQFAVIMFVMGLGSGYYLPCAVPIITSIFHRRHWGKVISFHETGAGFSVLSVPFLVASVVAVTHWRNVFLGYSALMLMLSAVFWFTSPDAKSTRSESAAVSKVVKRGDFWIICGLWVTCGMASIGIYNILPLFLVNERHMGVDEANYLLSITRIGGFLGQICAGYLLDRTSTKKMLLYITIFSALTGFGLAVAEGYWFLVTMLLLQGTFCVAFFPVGIVAVSKLTDPAERSTFTGLIMSFSGIIGIGITPWMLGAIADVWDFQVGIFLVSVFNLLTCIPVYWLKKM